MHIDLPGLRVHYDIQGSGPWLTLSNSLACDLTMWDDQMAALTRQFTVLRYDTRGHGGTSVTGGPYTFEALADDVRALWDALDIERSHFVGLSMGGMIGQHLALTTPDRLDRLVLCSTSSGYGDPAAVAKLWEQRIAQVERDGMEAMVEGTLGRWFTEPTRLAQTDTMARIGDLIRATPPRGYIACGRMIPTLATTDRLSAITVPTMVLVGDEDAGTPPAMAEIIAQRIPGARLEIIPQASHLLNIEQSELFNELLLAFLG